MRQILWTYGYNEVSQIGVDFLRTAGKRMLGDFLS